MAKSPEELAHIEWLGYVQPVGLVVSIPAMLEAQCYVNKNIMAEHARFLNCLARDRAGNVQTELRDLREFVQSVLGWESEDLITLPERGAPTRSGEQPATCLPRPADSADAIGLCALRRRSRFGLQ